MSRRVVTIFASIIAAVFGGGALAWACTAVPSIVSVAPASAPAQTPVTVRGQAVWNALDTGRAIEMRWDGVGGRVLAEANVNGPNFSATFALPADATTGAHTIVAVPVGVAPTSVGRAVVEVTGSRPSGAGAFSSPAQGSTTASQLWGSAHYATPSSGPSGAFVAGVALLGVGSVGLLSGFAVATRRRRVVATNR